MNITTRPTARRATSKSLTTLCFFLVVHQAHGMQSARQAESPEWESTTLFQEPTEYAPVNYQESTVSHQEAVNHQDSTYVNYPALQAIEESNDFLLHIQNEDAARFLRNSRAKGGVDELIHERFALPMESIEDLASWIRVHEIVIRLCRHIEKTHEFMKSKGVEPKVEEVERPPSERGLFLRVRTTSPLSIQEIARSYMGQGPEKNHYLTKLVERGVSNYLIDLYQSSKKSEYVTLPRPIVPRKSIEVASGIEQVTSPRQSPASSPFDVGSPPSTQPADFKKKSSGSAILRKITGGSPNGKKPTS